MSADPNRKAVLPWWLTVIIVVETLPMFLGPIAALFFPSSMQSLTGGEGPTMGVMLYSARNLSVGLALIVAYVLKSEPMLFVLILIRLLTDLVDLPSLLHFGNVSNKALVASIFVFFYYIPAVVALAYLRGRLRS